MDEHEEDDVGDAKATVDKTPQVRCVVSQEESGCERGNVIKMTGIYSLSRTLGH